MNESQGGAPPVVQTIESKPHFLSLFAPMSSDGHLYYIRHFYKKSQNSYQSWNSLEFNVSDNTAT